jgi:hypothetical protein
LVCFQWLSWQAVSQVLYFQFVTGKNKKRQGLWLLPCISGLLLWKKLPISRIAIWAKKHANFQKILIRLECVV